MMKKLSMLFFLVCFELYYHQVLSDNRIDQQDVNSNSKEADSIKLNSVNPNLEITPSPKSASGWLHRSHSEKQRYHHGRRHHIYHEEKASEYFPKKANFHHHHHHRRHHHHHHHHHHKRGHHYIHVPEAQFSSKILVKARAPYEHRYQHHPNRLHYHVLDPMKTAQFPFEFAVAAPHPDENHHDHHHHRRHNHQHKQPHHIYSQSPVKLLN